MAPHLFSLKTQNVTRFTYFTTIYYVEQPVFIIMYRFLGKPEAKWHRGMRLWHPTLQRCDQKNRCNLLCLRPLLPLNSHYLVFCFHWFIRFIVIYVSGTCVRAFALLWWIDAKYKPSTHQELHYLNFDWTNWIQEKHCKNYKTSPIRSVDVTKWPQRIPLRYPFQ